MEDQMKLRLNDTDSDMIELITESPTGLRTMWAASHIDLLWQHYKEDRPVYNALKENKEIAVRLVLNDQEEP